MAPLLPSGTRDEQSAAERLEIARRYRETRGRELREIAAPHVEGEIVAVGQFSSLPLESLAAIPLLGAFFAFVVRVRQSRKRLTPNVLVALDSARMHLLGLRSGSGRPAADPIASFERAAVRVTSVTPKFMREEVVFEGAGERPLKLYASPLRTDPWAAEVVRQLGGDAPEPLDLETLGESG